MPFRDERKPIGGGEVAALHEPPPHPIPLPLGGGEGARRAGEGDVHGSDERLENRGAFHEPSLRPRPRSRTRPRPANLVSRTRTRTIGFMVPMHAKNERGFP